MLTALLATHLRFVLFRLPRAWLVFGRFFLHFQNLHHPKFPIRMNHHEVYQSYNMYSTYSISSHLLLPSEISISLIQINDHFVVLSNLGIKVRLGTTHFTMFSDRSIQQSSLFAIVGTNQIIFQFGFAIGHHGSYGRTVVSQCHLYLEDKDIRRGHGHGIGRHVQVVVVCLLLWR